jgi:starch-binding outer membrane protein SusE/F
MKKIFLNIITIVSAASFLFVSCKKDETKVIFKGGTPPVLSANISDSIPLPVTDTTRNAISFSWTNPNYEFSDGISSLNVNYYLQLDSSGSNFKGANMQTVAISSDLSTTFTVSSLNKLLSNGLLLATGVSHKIDVRVESFLGTGAEPLYSNTLNFKVVPFAPPPKIVPPASGELFITGDATPGNWQCGCGEAPLLTQKFTKVSPTLYEITINLTGGKSYTFVPVYGSWNAKYSIAIKNDPNEVNGGNFMVGGEDILAPSITGNYKITVNFQIGKFTVTKL